MRTEPPLPPPAPQILKHLARCPGSQDTLEGIVWWVVDSCIREWTPKIAETVEELVDRGFLEQKSSADGRVFYRASAQYLSTLRQQPPLTPDDDK